MPIVVASILGLLDLLFWWWGDRRLRALRNPKPWQVLLGVLVGAQFLMLAWWMCFPKSLQHFGNAFWKPASAWLYMWHLLVLPATMIALGVGYMVLGAARLGRALLFPGRGPAAVDGAMAGPAGDDNGDDADDHRLAPATGPAVVYPSRRSFLTAAATFAPQAVLGATLLVSATQIGKFRVRRMTLPMPGLPRGLDGLTIAHLSDTHAGRFVGERELEHVVEATRALAPDLAVFTGDLIDFNLIDLPPAIRALREIDRFTKVACCVGNHDLFEDGRYFRNRVRSAELGLMVDEAMPVMVRGERLELLGLDWGLPGAPRASGLEAHMGGLMGRRRDPGTFQILLAHHPHAFDAAAAAGVPLTLSGHTHGGQLMLTRNVGCGSVFKYVSGLYERGGSKLVVSNGVGNWFPLRVNAPAEIVHLTLTCA